METRFEELKKEILKRAKDANACGPEYKRAYKSETVADLCQVLKDNFNFACEHKVVCPGLITTFGKEFSENDIWCDVNRESGYLLVVDKELQFIGGTVIAVIRGNATIQDVWGNATIQNVWDNATIQNVRDNATIQNVWDNATIQNVRDNAYISACTNIECKLSGNSILRIRSTNEIIYASDSLQFKKQ